MFKSQNAVFSSLLPPFLSLPSLICQTCKLDLAASAIQPTTTELPLSLFSSSLHFRMSYSPSRMSWSFIVSVYNIGIISIYCSSFLCIYCCKSTSLYICYSISWCSVTCFTLGID
ncbi:hypothetical protein O6P43_032216 [Quillaja saponaria]|uniref:Uncharacterized protein n=1 Tax=Quillaja saponaria TaxID=32244 RepID=A0AAD7KX44_QUISA|nr:hypothetical protein O6P43_032216 [Quillaja saponaria]